MSDKDHLIEPHALNREAPISPGHIHRTVWRLRNMVTGGWIVVSGPTGLLHEHCRVRVDLIALAGVAAETSAVIIAYLDEAYKRRKKSGQLTSLKDLIDTVHGGAVERIRPMAMAGLANILGLLPVMWASGTGADVMKRLAAPMVGEYFRP